MIHVNPIVNNPTLNQVISRRFLGRAGAVVLALGMAGGCADVITFSKDAEDAGTREYGKGNYADAAGAFNNSIRQNPRNYQAYYSLGVSYEQLNKMQQALQAYKSGLEVQQLTLEGRDDNAFRVKLINALAAAIAKSDTRDAETDWAEHKAKASTNTYDFLLLAKVYAFRGDPDSAIDAYNRAVILAPENFDTAKEYGLYLERLGQTQKAEAPLRRAYALNGNDPQVNEALRRIGIVPGPAVMDSNQLAKPLVPKGPIPELRFGDQPTAQTPRE